MTNVSKLMSLVCAFTIMQSIVPAESKETPVAKATKTIFVYFFEAPQPLPAAVPAAVSSGNAVLRYINKLPIAQALLLGIAVGTILGTAGIVLKSKLKTKKKESQAIAASSICETEPSTLNALMDVELIKDGNMVRLPGAVYYKNHEYCVLKALDNGLGVALYGVNGTYYLSSAEFFAEMDSLYRQS